MLKNNRNYIINLIKNLEKKSRTKIIQMYGLTIATSAAEMLSLGAIVPFLALLSNPEKFEKTSFYKTIIVSFPFIKTEHLLIYAATSFAIAGAITGILRTKLLKRSILLSNQIGIEISEKIIGITLRKPYHFHIETNSSEIISTITQKTNNVTIAINSIVTIINSTTLFLAIYTALLIINAKIAILSSFIFGIIYYLINKSTKQRIKSNSKTISEGQTFLIKIIQESLGNIRDIILERSHDLHVKKYTDANKKLRKSAGENQYYSLSPRFYIEALGINLIALYTIIYSLYPTTDNIITTLGTLALGSQRLIPLLQQAYGNWVVISGSRSEITQVNRYLESEETIKSDEMDKLDFQSLIELRNVSYKYQRTSRYVIQDINLKINKGDRIGIVGKTGSGKSTILDLIMGLIEPTGGKIYVDNQNLDINNMAAWQRKIAHVPQTMYVLDATIAENIAFGVPYSKMDRKKIALSMDLAGLRDLGKPDEYIYTFNVGERGAKLSGGQRQRLCIARALYKDPEILVFDEATSALDQETELSVVNSLAKLQSSLTIIMVAHKTETLKICNKIFEIQNERIIRRH